MLTSVVGLKIFPSCSLFQFPPRSQVILNLNSQPNLEGSKGTESGIDEKAALDRSALQFPISVFPNNSERKEGKVPIKPENPLNLPTKKLTLGCPVLDRLLHGGLPVGSVTELAGESGTGKTQLCLQLLLAALSTTSLYIHSEFPFPLHRLRLLSSSGPSSTTPNPLNHVFVRPTHSPDDLLSLLAAADALLTRPPSALPVRLLVVDSIAAIFRSEFDNTPADLKRWSSLFFQIAAKLKEQARRFGAMVVVTNQVVDVVGGSESKGVNGNAIRMENYWSLWSSGRRVCPALGLSWVNCINTRIFLSRSDEVVRGERALAYGESDDRDHESVVRTRRRMDVVFAPHLPEGSCEFVIVREGVFGVEAQR